MIFDSVVLLYVRNRIHGLWIDVRGMYVQIMLLSSMRVDVYVCSDVYPQSIKSMVLCVIDSCALSIAC